MHGIASLIDAYYSSKVQAIWHELEVDCGLTGIQISPGPHFSWQVAEGYDQAVLIPILKEIARKTRPFIIHTGGLGIFTGENPVVYITVVKDAQLIQFHEMLWERTVIAMTGGNQLYAPSNWIPHITLAYGDVNRESLSCAMQRLAFVDYDWEIKIDHLVFGGLTDGEVVPFKMTFAFDD